MKEKTIVVRVVPADRPDGRIVIRLVDALDGGLVRLSSEAPIHYESVASALEACAAAGAEVTS